MSDQPKPTGEWTVTKFGAVQLNGKMMVMAYNYDQGKALVDAINAALAAEREEWKSAEDLTADNGRLHGELAKALRDNEQLTTQLAAEREKYEKRLAEVVEQVRLSTVPLLDEVQQLREQLAAAEQSASDNSDWFDALCIELREILGMPKCEAPFEVSPIMDEVRQLSKAQARESERKSVHAWLNDIGIPREENGNRICLLRRLRITLDRFLNQQAAMQPFVKIASEAKTNRNMLGTLTDEDFENLLSSDTTALDAAIAKATAAERNRRVLGERRCVELAAAQQPLVDALREEVERMINEEKQKRPIFDCSSESYVMWELYYRMNRKFGAKVKEGKV